MALSTYTELKASLAGWLHRADVNGTASGAGVDTVVADWITLVEADLNAELRLRVMESDRTLATVQGSRTIDLPADFIEPLGLMLQTDANTDPYPLQPATVEVMGKQVQANIPAYWGIDGDQIRFECPANAVYTVVFRQVGKFALSDAAPTNWLLTNYPNLYLYGALMHSPGYVGVEERSSLWPNMYGASMSRLIKREARSRPPVTLFSDPALLNRNRSGFNIYRGW